MQTGWLKILKILTRFDVPEGILVCGTRGNDTGGGSNCKGLPEPGRIVSTVMMFFSSSVQTQRESLSIQTIAQTVHCTVNLFFVVLKRSPLKHKTVKSSDGMSHAASKVNNLFLP